MPLSYNAVSLPATPQQVKGRGAQRGRALSGSTGGHRQSLLRASDAFFVTERPTDCSISYAPRIDEMKRHFASGIGAWRGGTKREESG